jgi:hypothetical protein
VTYFPLVGPLSIPMCRLRSLVLPVGVGSMGRTAELNQQGFRRKLWSENEGTLRSVPRKLSFRPAASG